MDGLAANRVEAWPTRRIMACLWALLAVLAAMPGAVHAAPLLTYRVTATRPHDPECFTEGLQINNGRVYESSGLYGRSFIRVWSLDTGAVIHETSLPERLFAEGLTLARGELVVLTWHEGLALRYGARHLSPRKPVAYLGQGWGLAFDGRRFIQGNGSEYLVFRHPETFRAIGRLRVTDNGEPVRRLNELEWVPARTSKGAVHPAIAGRLLANVWFAERIAVINPASGKVEAWIDLSPLSAQHGGGDPDAVANGVAFDARTGKLHVTGKYWPIIYELELTPPGGTAAP